MKLYRKQPIEAEQFDGTKQSADKLGIFKYRGGWYLETLEGSMLVSNGYWIAAGTNGEHWAIADDAFNKTYAELPVIPKAVADWIEKCKHDGTSISFAMDEDKFPKEVAYYFRTYYTRDQWIEIQDTFARAWLDGYTVEDYD